MGTNSFTVSRADFEEGFIPPSPIGGLPIELMIKNGELLINTEIVDKEGNIIIKIVRNKWALNKNLCFSVNHDENGIEVIDTKGLMVLQILLNGNNLVISFMYRMKNVLLVANHLGTRTFKYSNKDYSKIVEGLKQSGRLYFQHKGDDYVGKRIKKP